MGCCEAAARAWTNDRLGLAGRLATPAGPASEIDPLGDRQGVIKLDTEVADRAVHLGMTEQ